MHDCHLERKHICMYGVGCYLDKSANDLSIVPPSWQPKRRNEALQAVPQHRHCENTHAIAVYLGGWCYSLSPLSWYLSLFLLTSHSFTLWYVLIRLGTLSDSLEFSELFFYQTITRAVLVLILPDGIIPLDSFLVTLIMDSLASCPILSYWTHISHYSSISFLFYGVLRLRVP